MKKRLLAVFRFVWYEAKRILRFVFRHTFSWYGGLLGFLLLVVILLWLLVYVPTIGEAKRIDAITAEFKAHGCRSIHSVAVPMFETHWLLKHFKLEKKVLVILVFGPGAVIPQQFLERPPYLPDLGIVAFEDSNPSDAEFIWAVQNPALELLQISGEHRVSIRGFQVLTERQAEIYLVFSTCDSIARDLSHLASCSPGCLTTLALNRCELDDSCMALIAKLDSIKWLRFEESWGYSAQGLEPLKYLPNLLRIDGLPPDKQAEFDERIRLRIESTP